MKLRPYHHYTSRRSAVVARNVVSTSQPLAAQAGLSMLAQGGNAVAAALAAAITLTLVEPTGNGIGSDAFCILWDGDELHGLNASGRSPAGWTPAYFADHEAVPMLGWDSVTVPGAVSAWVSLSERFGKLPFDAPFTRANWPIRSKPLPSSTGLRCVCPTSPLMGWIGAAPFRRVSMIS